MSKPKPENQTVLNDGDELEFEAHHGQTLILTATQRFIVACCGRRWGKDHVAPIKIMSHSFAFQSPRGGKQYAWLSPVYNPQGKDAFRTVLKFAESAGLLQGKIETPPQEITLINGDRISFFSMEKPDNLRGGQYDGIVINEAGLIPDLEALWNGPIAAMLLDRKGWALIQGTPKGKNGFHRFFLRGMRGPTLEDGTENPWVSFRFPSASNPFLDPVEIERLRSELPEDMFRQEFLAEFLESDGVVFKGLDAMKKRGHNLSLENQFDNCRIGLDVAKHSDFTVLTAIDPQNRLVGFDRFNQLDWPIIENRVVAFAQRFRGRIIMDATGIGDPLYSALVRRGLSVEGVKINNERKTQMVQNLMLLIEQGVLSIPFPGASHDPARDLRVLWREFETYGYDVTPTGKIRYSAPAGGDYHDDCVTSLYLACSAPPPVSWGSGAFSMDLDSVRLPGETSDVLGY